jgi:hypothetical protein
MKRLLTHLRACDEARLCDYTMALLAGVVLCLVFAGVM